MEKYNHSIEFEKILNQIHGGTLDVSNNSIIPPDKGYLYNFEVVNC